MFSVASRSDVLFAFEHPFLLCARSDAQVKLCTRKIGRLKRNFPTPVIHEINIMNFLIQV